MLEAPPVHARIGVLHLVDDGARWRSLHRSLLQWMTVGVIAVEDPAGVPLDLVTVARAADPRGVAVGSPSELTNATVVIYSPSLAHRLLTVVAHIAERRSDPPPARP